MRVMNMLRTGAGITKIRTKLILSQIFIALIPFILVGIVGITFSAREARKNITQRSSQTVTQVSRTLDTYMEDLDKLVLTLSDEIAAADIKGGGDVKAGEIIKTMQNVMGRYDEIAGMLYADSGDAYISTGITRISRDSFKRRAGTKQLFWIPIQVT